MSQFDSGLITLASIEAIKKHKQLQNAVFETNKQQVSCQGQLKELLDVKQLDLNESWRIENQYSKVDLIQQKNEKIDMLFKNFHDASVLYHKAVTEAAVVHAEIMETINVSGTGLMQTKSFWIERLSKFVFRKKGFDKWRKENAVVAPSIFNQGKKELCAEISELREHFKWVPELDDFFTIV